MAECLAARRSIVPCVRIVPGGSCFSIARRSSSESVVRPRSSQKSSRGPRAGGPRRSRGPGPRPAPPPPAPRRGGPGACRRRRVRGRETRQRRSPAELRLVAEDGRHRVAEPVGGRLDHGDELRLGLVAGLEHDVAGLEGRDRAEAEPIELLAELGVGDPPVAEVHPAQEGGADQAPPPPHSSTEAGGQHVRAERAPRSPTPLIWTAPEARSASRSIPVAIPISCSS